MSVFLAAAAFIAALADGLRPPAWAAAGAALLWLAAAQAQRRPSWKAVWTWLPWLCWLVVSAAAGPEPLVSASVVARWLAVGLFFALARGAFDDQSSERWSGGLVLVGLLTAAAALATGAWARWRWGNSSGASMTGLIPPYYNYSVFLEAAAGAAASALGRWPIAAGLTAVIVIARGRGGLIALAAGVCAAAWRRGSARRAAGWLAVLGAIVLALTAFVVWRGGRWNYLLKTETSFKRPQIWRAAAQGAGEHPFLGSGPGLFTLAFAPRNFDSGYGVARYQFSTPYAHSEPLQAAAETGWVGLAFWLLAVGGSLWLAARRPPSLGRDAALAAAAAMTVHLLGDNMLQLEGLAFVYAGALACAAGPEEPAPAGGGWKAFCALMAVLSALAFVPRLRLDRLDARFDAAGDAAQRLLTARQALRVAPVDPGWRERAGLAALELGLTAEGQADLRQAAQRDSKRPFAWLALAETSPCEQALPLVGKALDDEPDFLSAKLLRDEALLKCGGAPGRAEAKADLAGLPALRAELARKADSEQARGYALTNYEYALLAFDAARYARDARAAGLAAPKTRR